jgi:hypothetical protein
MAVEGRSEILVQEIRAEERGIGCDDDDDECSHFFTSVEWSILCGEFRYYLR